MGGLGVSNGLTPTRAYPFIREEDAMENLARSIIREKGGREKGGRC
jgi:hypothetical protein